MNMSKINVTLNGEMTAIALNPSHERSKIPGGISLLAWTLALLSKPKCIHGIYEINVYTWHLCTGNNQQNEMRMCDPPLFIL